MFLAKVRSWPFLTELVKAVIFRVYLKTFCFEPNSSTAGQGAIFRALFVLRELELVRQPIIHATS